MLSGSGLAASAMQPKNASDINLFVSGAIGSRGTSERGTSVFGGDVFISGSLYARQSQIHRYTEALSTSTVENFLSIAGGAASTSFSKSRHQFIAPYAGTVKKLVVRSSNADGSNALNVKVYSSNGSDAVTSGASRVVAVTVGDANSTKTDNVLHSFNAGDAIAVSVQRNTTGPGDLNLSLVFEYIID
mgnify:CR=1 FL=1